MIVLALSVQALMPRLFILVSSLQVPLPRSGQRHTLSEIHQQTNLTVFLFEAPQYFRVS